MNENAVSAMDRNRENERGARTSLRQCALTRETCPVDAMIRFVAAPDGMLCPDVRANLPGRGVWVSATRDAVEKAVQNKVFARGLKQKVSVPEGLADLVEELLERRALEALSLANKAGNVVSGFDKVARLVERGRATALLHACDAAAGGREKLDRRFLASRRGEDGSAVTIFGDLLTIAQMSLAIGRPNVVHAGLSKGGAAAKFVMDALRLRGFQAGAGVPDPVAR